MISSFCKYIEAGIVCTTETWLSDSCPDSCVNLDGFNVFRSDLTPDSGMTRGGARGVTTTTSTLTPERREAVVCVCVPTLTARGVTTTTSTLTPERREAVVCVCVPTLTARGVTTTTTSTLTPERREAVVCVCAYINSKWCNNDNIHVTDRTCTPYIEVLSLSIRPYYLPRKFPKIKLNVVSIPPQANFRQAEDHITSLVHDQINKSPDSIVYYLSLVILIIVLKLWMSVTEM
ncbi:hypothetical protein RRG08_060540 [Elysia crispata]|uniref:Uncharacterized protein n=1 Tax=Elysia crispata TaxID=231223 RepID=A0AAE1D6Y9_9GAST|nr:hypothetical protein RRG08_060540 [Elysia crispata]